MYELANVVIKKAPLSWTLRNVMRWGYITGLFNYYLAKVFSFMTGIPTLTGRVGAILCHNGEYTDYGWVGYKCVTTAGVGFLVDAWQGSVEPEIMKYHGCGTGAVAEATSDTGLGTECTTALNPDSTRATGTLAEGSAANIFSSVGTITFDDTASVTEHGLFSQAATGGGVLWDRTVMAAISVVATDTITWTYQCTANAGG